MAHRRSALWRYRDVSIDGYRIGLDICDAEYHRTCTRRCNGSADQTTAITDPARVDRAQVWSIAACPDCDCDHHRDDTLRGNRFQGIRLCIECILWYTSDLCCADHGRFDLALCDTRRSESSDMDRYDPVYVPCRDCDPGWCCGIVHASTQHRHTGIRVVHRYEQRFLGSLRSRRNCRSIHHADRNASWLDHRAGSMAAGMGSKGCEISQIRHATWLTLACRRIRCMFSRSDRTSCTVSGTCKRICCRTTVSYIHTGHVSASCPCIYCDRLCSRFDVLYRHIRNIRSVLCIKGHLSAIHQAGCDDEGDADRKPHPDRGHGCNLCRNLAACRDRDGCGHHGNRHRHILILLSDHGCALLEACDRTGCACRTGNRRHLPDRIDHRRGDIYRKTRSYIPSFNRARCLDWGVALRDLVCWGITPDTEIG